MAWFVTVCDRTCPDHNNNFLTVNTFSRRRFNLGCPRYSWRFHDLYDTQKKKSNKSRVMGTRAVNIRGDRVVLAILWSSYTFLVWRRRIFLFFFFCVWQRWRRLLFFLVSQKVTMGNCLKSSGGGQQDNATLLSNSPDSAVTGASSQDPLGPPLSYNVRVVCFVCLRFRLLFCDVTGEGERAKRGLFFFFSCVVLLSVLVSSRLG